MSFKMPTIKTISTYAGYLSAIAGGIGVLWTLFVLVESARDKAAEQSSSFKKVETQQQMILDSLVSISRQNNSIKIEVKAIGKGMERLDRRTGSIQSVVSNHVIKTADDKEEIIDMVKEFREYEKKKNGTSMFEIPYRPEGF